MIRKSLVLKPEGICSRRLRQSLLEIFELRRTWRVFWARKPDRQGSGRAAQPGRAAGSTKAEALNLKNKPTRLVRGVVEGSNPSGPATTEPRPFILVGLVL